MSRKPGQKSDAEVFRDSVGEVAPVRQPERSASRPRKPAPEPLQSRRDERAVIRELLDFPGDPVDFETGEEIFHLRPGYQKRYLTRLRRGHYSVADSIDLHRMNEATAANVVRDFLEESIAAGRTCIRIVHGKGLRSRNGPKLKFLVRRLLSRHPGVIAFASCKPVDGGTGAVTVLLKRS